MKTNDLIDFLSTNVEPAGRRAFAWTFGWAIAAGVAAAVGASWFLLGVRPDWSVTGALIHMVLKLAFALIVLLVASVYMAKLSRPGVRKTTFIWIALPFIGVVLLAAVALGMSPRAHWERMMVGGQWFECLLSIPLIAIVPFSAVVLAARSMAPTDLRRAGAVAGLVAGSISAAAYALHCSDDSVAFVALWYGGTIALCASAGALLGPRLLRW